MIDIENGKDYSFKDGFYFNVENLYNKVEIYESEYISDRKVVKGFEVKDHSGNWVKITELAKNGSSWTTDSSFSYKDIINNYLQGKYPDCLEIRAILEDAELPVKVKVTNGYINIGYNDYGSESDCLANETIVLMPKYDEDKYIASDTIYPGGWYSIGSHTFTVPNTGATLAISGSMSTSNFNPNSASAEGKITLTEILGKIRVRINNSWKKAVAYIGVSGTWKKCKVYIGKNNTWKPGK